MDVFFLFPGRVWIVFYLSLGSEKTKTLPGKSPLSVLEPSAVILNFGFGCQYFFYLFFGSEPYWRPHSDGRALAKSFGGAAIRTRPGGLLFALRTLFP